MKKLVSSILIAALSMTVLMPVTAMEENVTKTQTASTAMSQNTLDVIIGGDVMWDCAIMAMVLVLSPGVGGIFIIAGMIVAGCFG